VGRLSCLSRTRWFGARLVLSLSLFVLLSGCATLTQASQAKSVDLLPSIPDGGLFLGRDAFVALGESISFAFDRVQRVYLAQSTTLPRPFGEGGSLVLIHGRFPSFVLEWIFGTRFGMRKVEDTKDFEADFPRHRIMVPGPRTNVAFIQLLGDSVGQSSSADFTESIESLESLVIFDEGTFGLYFQQPILGKGGEFLGQLFGPAPWAGERVGWFRIPLDVSASPFGIGGVELDVRRNPGEDDGSWTIESRLVHLGSAEDQRRNQRVFGSTLRLLTLGMASQGLLAQDAMALRQEANFGANPVNVPNQGLFTLTEVEDLRIYPSQVEAVLRTLTQFLEAP